LTLSVLALPVSALPKPRIPQAANNGEGPELNLGNFTSIALRMDSYPFMAVGQFWWLRMRGTNANGSVFDTVYWKAPTAVVTQSLINNGFYEGPIAASSLMGLRDGSPLTMEFKAALGKSTNEAEAITFPLRTYTVKTIALINPTIERVTDSKGVVIPEGGETTDTTVILSGKAAIGLRVQLFDKGEIISGAVATANGSGNWSYTLAASTGRTYRITVKALYGSGEISTPKSFKIIPASVIETFESLPEGYGTLFETEFMTIRLIGPNSQVWIGNEGGGLKSVVVASFLPLIPGTPLRAVFELKATYSAATIYGWIPGGGTATDDRGGLVRSYAANGRLLEELRTTIIGQKQISLTVPGFSRIETTAFENGTHTRCLDIFKILLVS
jgi:hypothetical protein